MGGGTEAFPELGLHCQHHDCNQLDFLPFKCDACRKVFCLEHRSHKSHECPNSDRGSRKVLVCEICSQTIETTGHGKEDEKAILERHEKSRDCDPSKKKKKPMCPVRRCRQVLTFSNCSTCKTCHLKVCLKHRFPADHACDQRSAVVGVKEPANKFLVALASRKASECAQRSRGSASPPTPPSVKAF